MRRRNTDLRDFLIAWVAIGVILLLADLAKASEPIVAEFHAHQAIVKIEWVDEGDELLDEEWGATSYYHDEETQTTICVITTSRPVLVDDVWSDTLGHELLHCLMGDYHEP